MLAALHLALGLALVATGWLIPRWLAGARIAPGPALAIDAAPLLVGAALLVVATGRPLFSGVVMFALGGGFAIADKAMRETLREPVVFQSMSEFPQVFTHSHLYLPFAGPGLVFGSLGAAIAAGIALLAFEPPVWSPAPLLALLLAALVVVAGWVVGHPPVLAMAADRARRLGPTGVPETDAALLGPFAMLFIHCTIARAERGERQRTLAPALAAPAVIGQGRDREAPIVLVQCESFFDARRLSPSVPQGLLPGFEECCRSGVVHGRLTVPGWGANTMRTEFAVLSGLSDAELGYDRFNPYYALARVPIASHVWRLRQAGYRTICLHPFTRRFFRRDVVMPALGFNRFLGLDALGGSRMPPYLPDAELGRHVLRVLDAEGPRTFIFAITMGNHGPWTEPGGASDPAASDWFDPKAVPQGPALSRYLGGLRRSDEMLQVLIAGLAERHKGATLAFYGDHLPSLPQAFAHFGFTAPQSDYALWQGGEGPARHADLDAHRLGGVLLDLAFGVTSEPEFARRMAGQ